MFRHRVIVNRGRNEKATESLAPCLCVSVVKYFYAGTAVFLSGLKHVNVTTVAVVCLRLRFDGQFICT